MLRRGGGGLKFAKKALRNLWMTPNKGSDRGLMGKKLNCITVGYIFDKQSDCLGEYILAKYHDHTSH